ncbi:alpha-galactosidase [Tamlana fucoidanivorans]|uniref:Alpha-galactosidase n=1 Tax=Allotamlana fucoidanivorans TaxID=2583814 RepID=A0A5C4SDM8_9FLAO|nr:glycoside hydrolase family 36 protein [Tamlana fucoidanivorans]TNJ41494.1 alpha-galactosidase [Tamlana fucoidanivorans]
MSIKKIITVLLLSLIFLPSCKQNTDLNYTISKTEASEALEIDTDSITINGDLGNFSVDKQMFVETEGVKLISFSFVAEVPSELQPVSITFKFPSIAINGYWNPNISVDKVNYYKSSVTAKASRYAPVLSFYDNDLKNRITIALSDAINQSEIVSYVKEEDVHFYPEIKLFHEKMPKAKRYNITLRIDTRQVPYYKSIDDVSTWWASNPEYKPMHVPDAAKNPMYSTWYSYHQNISMEEIVDECKLAKQLGCSAVIVDDGWQTNDSSRGYRYTGDWNPERIPNMKEFVDAVHDEGMQFILWYSLPFMGERAKNYPRFKGKYLRYWESQGTYVLDPRYPETRKYIVNTYIDALNQWGVDGFKLDFLGWFTANKDTELTKENGRDFASINNATDALMTEITNKLTAINPDVLIEFRQPYIGPVMRKYGNMFRGVDAPNNAVANKIEVTNLRMLSHKTAVHSDMFIWRKEETVEQAALQILNILYSVPQLSVKLKDIPETHVKMIKFWFNYWNENKKVLLDGEFIPSNPGANYPYISAKNNHQQITALYENTVIELNKNINRLDVVNAKSSEFVALKLKDGFSGTMKILNTVGEVIFEDSISLNSGMHELKIPRSGLAVLKRNIE